MEPNEQEVPLAPNPFEDKIDLDPAQTFLVVLEGATLPAGFDATARPAAVSVTGALRALLDASEGSELTIVSIKEDALSCLEAIAPYLDRNPILLVGLENEPPSKGFSALATKLGSITIHDLIAYSERDERRDKAASRQKQRASWKRTEIGKRPDGEEKPPEAIVDLDDEENRG